MGAVTVDYVVECPLVHPWLAQEQSRQPPTVCHPRFDVRPWRYARLKRVGIRAVVPEFA